MNTDDNMRRGNKYVLNEENFEAIIGMFRRWIFVLFKIKSIFTVEINTIKENSPIWTLSPNASCISFYILYRILI